MLTKENGYKGDKQIKLSVCAECEKKFGCTCHVCTHEIAELLDKIEPPRLPNLRKMIETTKHQDLLKK